MLKFCVTTALIFFAAAANASPSSGPCLRLLTEPVKLPKYDHARLATALAWISERTADEQEFVDTLATRADFAAMLAQEKIVWSKTSMIDQLDLAARYILSQWERWKQISDRERDNALSLELMKLSPHEKTSTLPMNGDLKLTRLSQQNKERLLQTLSERYPLPDDGKLNKAIVELAQKTSADLNFEFLRSFENKIPTGYFPTLLSDREQRRLGLFASNSFYSKLVDTSATVGFTLFATKIDEPLLLLNGQKPQTALKLDQKFAAEHGFLIPTFKDSIELTNLFYLWDQKANERLMRQNWMNLPSEVNSLAKFYVYLDPESEKSIFPDDELYERMAPLREKLSQFVLTVDDGEDFLRKAFERYVLWVGHNHTAEDLKLFRKTWQMAGGPQNLFAGEFMAWLGWNGVSLRIPTVVTPSQFSIERIMDIPFRARARSNDSAGFHRLDKSQMP